MTVINANANLGGATAALQHVRSSWTFVAGTTGAVATHTVFTISGRVWLEMISAFCGTTLTQGGATASINLGTATSTAQLIANPTGGATDLVANDWWTQATTPGGSIAPLAPDGAGTQAASQRGKLMSEDIILTIGTQTVSGGVLVFDIWYYPITDGASYVATTPA